MVSVRNARFQQWRALLDNRTKRQQLGEFVVHGVRPITLAVEHDWPIHALLRPAGVRLSGWATGLLAEVAARKVNADLEHVEVAPDLLRELGEKADETPELIAIAQIPPDDPDRIEVPPDGLVVVFDRPASPGNIGTLIRSADAFGACGVVVTGHAADVYDPKAVRASTGSLFAVPTIRLGSTREVLDWVERLRANAVDLRIVGTDETGSADVDAIDLTGPNLLVVGNETRGMSAAWRDACDLTARIPMGGTASSLNASVAATVVFYEAARQRRRGRRASD
ncbi:TrmH family RNA methyltransferase [Actinopolymorpha alba]|uniref:TrmH family RNA methyltransferase n=1 Tax=Actinopolymorpha alba TaxID=533267 RepID=UPI0003679ED4|nr:TrmH family RNA methyltransferase [Actinopolymorpha alba]